MRKLFTVALTVGVFAGVSGGSALADPPQPPNGHNCAGFTSTAVPPGIGSTVSALARSFPSAVPTTLDLANCGDNANGL
jgi:hypothetical protein